MGYSSILTMISKRPSAYLLEGFALSSLLKPEFMEKLKMAFPTIAVGHLSFGFVENEEVIFLSHDRKNKKMDTSKSEVQATDADLVEKIIPILEQVVR